MPRKKRSAAHEKMIHLNNMKMFWRARRDIVATRKKLTKCDRLKAYGEDPLWRKPDGSPGGRWGRSARLRKGCANAQQRMDYLYARQDVPYKGKERHYRGVMRINNNKGPAKV
jgi:hypothetical protein